MTDIQDIGDLKKLHRTRSIENRKDSHHYIVLHHLYKWMETVAPQYVRGRMLDYGCGGQTYRSLFEGSCDAYIGADVAAAPGVVLDLEIIPNTPLEIEADSIDCILSNQVLEHVPDPDFYLGEAARMLKLNGTLILTAPMQWRHHEVPFDYYRYTKYGLEELLTKNGLEIERLDCLGGVFSLIGQIFCSFYSERRKIYNSLFFRVVNSICLRLDRRFVDTEDTLGWMCIARKVDKLNDQNTSKS